MTTTAGGPDTLGPQWTGLVPPPFRTAAASIERRRHRLVGDPPSLEALAESWAAQATQVDGVWERIEGYRATGTGEWAGHGAKAFQDRSDQLIGELSATATSLRFAAVGLRLVAGGLRHAQARANQVVLRYLADVNALYVAALRVHGPGRATAVAAMMADGEALGREALQSVYAQEVWLDALLASVPRRFVLGSASPWRRGIQSVVESSTDYGSGGAFTLAGGRLSRREGMMVRRLVDGRIQVVLTDAYGVGPHFATGAKMSFDALPTDVRAALTRAYGEIEGAAVTGYSLRYNFDGPEEAEEFVDRIAPPTWWGRVVAGARDTTGFWAGPLADFGPWHDSVVGRRPDEVSLSLTGAVKAQGDAGLPPLASAQATASGEVTGTVVLQGDGKRTMATELGGSVRVGGTAPMWTELRGLSGKSTERTSYDEKGQPVRYTVQVERVDKFDYVAGTNNSYLGVDRVPVEQLPKGAHAKADALTATRLVTTYHLDLTEPVNRRLYLDAVAAAVVPPEHRGPRELAALDSLTRQVSEHGVRTTQEARIERDSAEVSASVGLGPVVFSAKAGPVGEEQYLVNAVYRGLPDPAVPGDVPSVRPVPRDPRFADPGPVDVPTTASSAG